MDYSKLASNGELSDDGIDYGTAFQDEHFGLPSDELYAQLPADMPDDIKGLMAELWSTLDKGMALLVIDTNP